MYTLLHACLWPVKWSWNYNWICTGNQLCWPLKGVLRVLVFQNQLFDLNQSNRPILTESDLIAPLCSSKLFLTHFLSSHPVLETSIYCDWKYPVLMVLKMLFAFLVLKMPYNLKRGLIWKCSHLWNEFQKEWISLFSK